MSRFADRPSQFGPFIRNLAEPEGERPLQPGKLRSKPRLLARLPSRLYGAAMVAWTLGLVLASYGVLHPGGESRAQAAAGAPQAQPAEQRPADESLAFP